jgi:hypothetical protein
MKISLLPTILTCTILLALGCKKEVKEEERTERFLRGVLANQPFEATTNITATRVTPFLGYTDPTLRIIAEWPPYLLTLFITHEEITVGNYPFAADKQRSSRLLTGTEAFFAGLSTPPGVGQFVGSGNISITSISADHVKGNFNFTAWDGQRINSITLTNGQFSIPRE